MAFSVHFDSIFCDAAPNRDFFLRLLMEEAPGQPGSVLWESHMETGETQTIDVTRPVTGHVILGAVENGTFHQLRHLAATGSAAGWAICWTGRRRWIQVR
ncbi:hypothetical protein [Streptomyces sp. NPDC001450]